MAHVSDSDACCEGLNQEPFISVSMAAQPFKHQDSSRIASEPLVSAFAAQEQATNPKIALSEFGEGSNSEGLESNVEKSLSADEILEKTSVECGASEGNSMVPNQDFGLENVLEVKKKRLLEELESVLFPKDEVFGHEMVQEVVPLLRPSLGIEVIDETALVETIAASGIGKKTKVPGSNKSNGKDAITEIDVKIAKQSRRRAKGAKKVLGMGGRHRSVSGVVEARSGSGETGEGTKKKYTRKEMEALRFVNMEEQRKFWKAIYSALDSAVAKEYDTLASNENQKYIGVNFDPRQCFAKKKEAPAILGVGAANGRWRYVNLFVH